MLGDKTVTVILTSQEFKDEGYNLLRTKDLTVACQFMMVWGMKEQWPTFPKQFLLCSLRVCKGLVLPVAGAGGEVGEGVSPRPGTFPRKVAFVLHWRWTRGGLGALSGSRCRAAGRFGAATQAAASCFRQNPREQRQPDCTAMFSHAVANLAK